MLRRRLSRPRVITAGLMLPIEKGGTNALDKTTASDNLGFLRNFQIAENNGIAVLDRDEKLIKSQLPVEIDHNKRTSLSGSKIAYIGKNETYTITKF